MIKEYKNNSGRTIHKGEAVCLDDSGWVSTSDAPTYAEFQERLMKQMSLGVSIPMEKLTASIARAGGAVKSLGLKLARIQRESLRATIDEIFLPKIRNCINEKQYRRVMARYTLFLEATRLHDSGQSQLMIGRAMENVTGQGKPIKKS